MAERLYRRVLAVVPDNADCLHMLGVVCYQTRRPWQAFDLIRRALELTDWKNSPMRYNLGLVVGQLIRESEDAVDDLRTDDDGPWAAVRGAGEKLATLARNAQQYSLTDDRQPFQIPAAEAPRVSIVIPAYAQHAYTHSCVRSIVRHTEPGQYEIVLVDDASPEPVAAALPHVTGLQIVRNESNLGFIASCARGAELARGEILVLLNNDTLVTDGWLTALLAALANPEVGLVGAKLIYPDGTLQEAGGIVWRDGLASNYGRNDDPGKPEYNYLRDVDYCSAACLAMRRREFLALGGFDELFAPAYYEDTDLAMRMRATGKRVVYQPAAKVVHFEGATSGQDVRDGVKRHQGINQARFLDRWRDVLADHRESVQRPDLEKDRGAHARVLVVDAYMPTPDKDAGSVRICAIMSLLIRAGCAVTFVAQSVEFVEGYGQQLQQAGIEVLHQPYVWSVAQILAQRGADLDFIIVSRHHVAASCIAAARRYAPQALFALDTVDLHFVREHREAEITGDAQVALQAAVTQRQELEAVRSADVTLVVSEAERATLADVAPGAPVLVLSTVHEVRGRMADFSSRRDIFFVGGFNHPPNVDAVVWYASEVWPLVRERLPGVKTFLIGSNMPKRVEALAVDGIEAVGHVPDLVPYLDGCRLSVAPLRFGAGVKGKIVTAHASGVPVVATTLAVEGMFLEDGRDVLVADSAADFADAIVRLYSNALLWTAISDAAMANVARHFSPDAAASVLQEMLAMAESKRARRSEAGEGLRGQERAPATGAAQQAL